MTSIPLLIGKKKNVKGTCINPQSETIRTLESRLFPPTKSDRGESPHPQSPACSRELACSSLLARESSTARGCCCCMGVPRQPHQRARAHGGKTALSVANFFPVLSSEKKTFLALHPSLRETRSNQYFRCECSVFHWGERLRNTHELQTQF